MDGWFGPKLIVSTSSESRSSCGTLEHGRDRATGSASPRRSRGARGATVAIYSCLREADRLAADRVVLAQRVALPVVLHQDPLQVRVALDRDAHHVPGLALVPVGGRPDPDDARAPARRRRATPARARAARPRARREQVVVHREALRLRRRPARQALGAGRVDVAAAARADVAGDALAAPAEVVGRGDVGEEAEAHLVAQVRARPRPAAPARRRASSRRAASRISTSPGHVLVGH